MRPATILLLIAVGVGGYVLFLYTRPKRTGLIPMDYLEGQIPPQEKSEEALEEECPPGQVPIGFGTGRCVPEIFGPKVSETPPDKRYWECPVGMIQGDVPGECYPVFV